MDKHQLKNLLRTRMGLATVDYDIPEAPTESIELPVPRRIDPLKQVLSGIEGRVGATTVKVLAILVMVGGSFSMFSLFYSPYAVVYSEGFFPVLFQAVYFAPFIWLSSRVVVGARKGGLLYAIWIGIVALGVQYVSGMYLEHSSVLVLILVTYLGLVKYYYDTSWRRAFLVGLCSAILISIILFLTVFVYEL